jgi:drug/metabolite transporter (DMT)-like permease
MSALTLALVLASAVVHASWNLWAKQLGPAVRPGALMWSLTALSACVYGVPAVWLLVHAGWRPDGVALVSIVGSGLIHIAYFLLLLRGYRVGELSVVYPVARGTGPLVASVAALALFGERASVAWIAGLALVLAGIVVLTWRPGPRGSGSTAPGLGHGLAIGLLIGVYTLWDGWGVKRAGVPPLVFYWGGEVVRALVFTPAALADRRAVATLWKREALRVVGIALASPLSYILVLLAMRAGAVSHVAPAREIGILFGAWLGGHVLGEGDRARRRVAAIAFAAGVLALAFARA